MKDTIRTRPKMWASAALVTAGLAGGAVLGTTFSAGAATTTTAPAAATAPAASTTPDTPASGAPQMPAHGSASHESAETAVTGDNATKAQAAAVKAVGSGTAGAVTADFTKNGYEVTVTKADGSTVEVHLDSTFTVMQGGPGGPGGHGDGDGDGGPGAPSSGSSSSASA